MIHLLRDTSTAAVVQTIADLHLRRGEPEHSRVLTLLISLERQDLEDALDIAKAASHAHPCRIIAVVTDAEPCDGPLCAELRIGSDAGAGEIIVLSPTGELTDHLDSLVIPLLVPNAPVVCWWPRNAPACPSCDLLGQMAQTRITDLQLAGATPDKLKESYDPQDIDLSWTRLTVWRALLASLVDQPPHLPITRAVVKGSASYLPMDLMVAWLAWALPDAQIEAEYVDVDDRLYGVYLEREDGVLSIERPNGDQTIMSLPHQTPQSISVHPRTREECLIEELQRLDTDEVYAQVIARL